MMPDRLRDFLCCPSCRLPLPLDDLDDHDLACACGATYPLRARLLDFHVQEQQWTNNWSGSAKETPEQEAARIDRWLATGLLTREDLEHCDRAVNEAPLRAAMDRAFAALREQVSAPESGVVLDLCTGMASLFGEALVRGLPRDRTIVLTDLSTTVLRRGLDSLMDLQPSACLLGLACDVGHLPVRDNAVDLVTGIAAAGNLDHGQAALAEAHRALRPGGRLRLCELLYMPGSRTARWAAYVQTGSLADRDRLASSLQAIGFREAHLETLFAGLAHLAGDLYPLLGDDTIVSLVSAGKG